MDLFINTPQAAQEKTASHDLGEDVSKWGREILKFLYVQTPEIAEFIPEIQILRVDEEQGSMLGVAVISSSANDTEMVPSNKIYAPLVVRGFKLFPVDLFMNRMGKLFPLTKSRLRQAMFRPEIFDDSSSEEFANTSLQDMFYPPGRTGDMSPGSGQGFSGNTGGVSTIFGPGVKTSAAQYDILSAILPTILANDIQHLSTTIEATPGLLKTAGGNPALLGALSLLGDAEGGAVSDGEPFIKRAMQAAPTHVIQMGYHSAHNGYWVKTASRVAFGDAMPLVMSRGEFLKFAGEEVARKVDTEGVVTLTTNATVDETTMGVDTENWAVVTEPGIYRVKTLDGKELTGWVIPNLTSTEGVRLPLSLFTNGSAAMVQDTILGLRVGIGSDLPSSPPKGPGVFYVSGRGGIQATEPVIVQGGEADMDGNFTHHVVTSSGEDAEITLVEGIKQMTTTPEAVYLPASARFLALNEESAVPLVSHANELTKTAELIDRPRVDLTAFGDDEFVLRFTNAPKLASVMPVRQSYDDAVFSLCVAGLGAKAAHTKLASAMKGAKEWMFVDDVRLATDLLEKTASSSLKESQEATSLRRFLVKEAAVLPDSMSVDSVLSLGFINSENIGMFVGRIPTLETAMNHIAEILLGSRLGLVEVPEPAAARCVRALDDVLMGLKALSMRSPVGDTE